MMSLYHHSPLSQPRNSIRLLQLLPRREDPKYLRCKLLECILRDSDQVSRPFEALSYFWGGEHKTRSIIIVDDRKDKQKNEEGNQKLAVTENLYNALLHLQDNDISRIIWADGVCIDQSNTPEKEDQIPLMAEIYATASRVIVWLGEAKDDSDNALKAIRVAAGSSINFSKIQHPVPAISALLERSWFHRIWVLQEVAAAQHVVIKCGAMEIDGYAFCLGSDFISTALKQPILQATFLIRGAIFRSRYIPQDSKRLSLGICSLGELVDMYHAHKATIFHDKVYALLGMCSDNPELLKSAGLEPEYGLEQKELMRRLTKFLLGDQVSVEVLAWRDTEIAVIKSNGRALGKVSKIESKVDLGGNVQSVEAVFRNVLGAGKDGAVCWTLRTSAKAILEGDLICLLPGALQPSIIRLRKDHFAIIRVAALLPEQIMWRELSQSTSFTRDFLLVWDWEISSENLQDSYDIWTRTKSLQSEHSGTGLEGQLENAIRRWNVVLVLGDLGECEKMEEELYEVVRGPVMGSVEEKHPYIQSEVVVDLLLETGKTEAGLEDKDGRGLLSYAAAKGHSILVKLLLETCKAGIESKDCYGQTSLLWAARNGHEAVIKLLLKAKANTESEDSSWRTSLLWAARNGHEAVVKLLLEAKANTESEDESGQTSLSWAARNGHEAVVKLLLEAKANTESEDSSGRTSLLWAARNGHEAVVKLLLEARANTESKDCYGQTSLLWAAKNGHKAVIKLLLKANANTESKDSTGQTSLLWAAENGHEAVVKLLLEANG